MNQQYDDLKTLLTIRRKWCLYDLEIVELINENDDDETNKIYYIQTQNFKSNYLERLDLLQTLLSSETPLHPFLEGIDNFLVLDYTEDSVCSLDCKEYSSSQSKLSLQNLSCQTNGSKTLVVMLVNTLCANRG